MGAARALVPVVASTTDVAARGRQDDNPGFKTIADVVPEKGLLGSLLRACRDNAGENWPMLAACDWVGAHARPRENFLAETTSFSVPRIAVCVILVLLPYRNTVLEYRRH